MRKPTRRTAKLLAGAASATLALALLAVPAAQAVDPSSPVVLNEVYGGGGNSSATYKNDFIELANSGSSAASVDGWYVWYASSSGSFSTGNRTALTGSVAAGATYLISEAAGSGGTQNLPASDATGSIALSATAGKVALTDDATMPTSSTGADVVDFVGYGSANDSAGGHPAPAPSNTTSDQRTDSPSITNAGDNAADFTAASPTPKALNGSSGGGGTDCSATPTPAACVPGPTTIQDVQGTGFLSTMAGSTVAKVEGIVTATRSSGFWIQEAAPNTSETNQSSGIFVYTTSSHPAVGDDLLVSAKVQEYYPLSNGETVSSTSNLSTTELSNVTAVTTLSRGNAVPAALVIGPDTVPDTALATPPSGSNNIEDITDVDPSRSAQEFWEAHEGMLVSVSDARVVGPGKPQYGEIYVTDKPDEDRNSSGGTTYEGYGQQPAGRLLVAPLSGTVPAANVGDVLTGTTAGPVDWSLYGGYDIAATTIGTRQDNDLQPTVAPTPAADELSVATYNVENLMPSDPDSKYSRLAQGIVTNLASPDIISVEEVQDNDGATDDGVVAADQTIGKLVQAISDAGGPDYSSAEIDPANDQDGGQPGGNIRIVFLYNPDRVGFTPRSIDGDDPTTTPVAVSTAADGTPTLSENPGRVDPTNPAWNSSRKPLAGEFTFDGQKVIVVGNHFDAKLGDQNSDGRYQPPARSSETQRMQQATVLNGFVKDVQHADPSANVVLAGDFNDFQFSPAVHTLTDDGNTLTDLINTLPVVDRYTYNYDGISQVLDHIFVSNNLTPATDYTVVHANAEFADQVSDHDPQVARITLDPPEAGTVTTPDAAPSAGGTLRLDLAGWAPKDRLTVTLQSVGTHKPTVSGKGAGFTTFALPSTLPTGDYTVTATDPATHAVARTSVHIDAKTTQAGAVGASPSTVTAGATVTVSLSGWTANTRATITLDGGGKVLARPSTSGKGNGFAKITVPAGTSAGTHRVVATAPDGSYGSATVTVTTSG